MKINEKGLDIIKYFEGCRLSAYRCPAGVLTIGYGHTRGVKQGDKITQEQAEQYLKEDLKVFETHVMSFNDKYNWSNNEFSALVSFAFNIGSITSLTARGTRSKEEIADKMLLYDYAGGKRLPGLGARRETERELFLTPDEVVLNDNIQSLKGW